MNWVRAITGVLVLWSSTAWGATLTWNANSEPDLAGYRVYQCSQLPCSRASGNASSLVTVGTVTSFNIGTPVVTQYYFITAYDFANNESTESGLTTFTPTGSPPPVVPSVIGASPTSLSFAATQGGANPATQTLSISNTGGGSFSWSAGENATWLTLSPVSGTGNGAVALTVTTGSLTAGSYSGAVTVSSRSLLSDCASDVHRCNSSHTTVYWGKSDESLLRCNTGWRQPSTPNLEHQQYRGRLAHLERH